MLKALRYVGLVGLIVGSAASAQTFGATEAQKRKALLPYVKAATDCIARQMLAQPGVVEAYRGLTLMSLLAQPWKSCVDELTRLASAHDYLHGAGTGIRRTCAATSRTGECGVV